MKLNSTTFFLIFLVLPSASLADYSLKCSERNDSNIYDTKTGKIIGKCVTEERSIEVKYKKKSVNIGNGFFVKYTLKESSFVNEIYYDNINKYLLVRLKETFYHYCSMPNIIVNDWVHAPSLGKYYLKNIKGSYDCRHSNPVEYLQ